VKAILRLWSPDECATRVEGSDFEEVPGGDVILVAKRLAAIRDATATRPGGFLR